MSKEVILTYWSHSPAASSVYIDIEIEMMSRAVWTPKLINEYAAHGRSHRIPLAVSHPTSKTFSPMRIPFSEDAGLSSRVVFVASSALILSGGMQLVTAWMQMRTKTHLEALCSPPPSPRTNPTYSTSLPISFCHALRDRNHQAWLGDDFPNSLPLDLGPPVALTFEDSRHYALDTPEADAEYLSIYPGGDLGFVRLGPNKRFFGLAMYHQIHCLDSLRKAILGHGHHAREGMNWKRDVEHSQHCLNYLRQAILCAGDLTLEPELVQGSREVGEGLAVTHVCRDWSKVHQFVQENYDEWRMWTNGTMS